MDYTVTSFYKVEANTNICNSSFFCTDCTPEIFSPVFRSLPDDISADWRQESEHNSWFTYNTIKTIQEVISMNESITVSGEKFSDCIHIRITDILNDDENDTSSGAVLNKLLNGVKDIWYAPNTGIIKHTFAALNGAKFSVDLCEYTINNKNAHETNLQKKYFPVALGNKWRYKATGDVCRSHVGYHAPSPDEWESDNLYETLYEENGNHYVSYWAYAYKK